jgi:hypothetical protein
MSKVKVQMKPKAQMTKLKREKVLIFSHLDIHLALACPPRSGPGSAGRQRVCHLDLIGQRSG